MPQVKYPISEVVKRTGLQAHVLRYWESEFPHLKPIKNSAGNREYSEIDIETILEIKRLLYDVGLTIPGAKKRLEPIKEERREESSMPQKTTNKDLIAELRNVLGALWENQVGRNAG